MSLSSVVKRNAKKALKKHWAKGIGVFLVPVFVSLAISFAMGMVLYTIFGGVPQLAINKFSLELLSQWPEFFSTFGIVLISLLIFSVISFLVFVPLELGAKRWHFSLAKGKPLPFTSVFYFFEGWKKYWRSLGLAITLGIRMIFWKFVFLIIPTALTAIGLIALNNNAEILEIAAYRILCLVGAVVLLLSLIIATFMFVAFINRYFLSEYIIGISDSNKIGNSIKRSIKYMKKYHYNLFWFRFSFVGWFVLGTILPPVMLYVMPYYSTSMGVYAQYIFETIKREQPVLIDQIPDFKSEVRNPEIKTPVSVPPQNNALPKDQRNPVWGEDSFDFEGLDLDALDRIDF